MSVDITLRSREVVPLASIGKKVKGKEQDGKVLEYEAEGRILHKMGIKTFSSYKLMCMEQWWYKSW